MRVLLMLIPSPDIVLSAIVEAYYAFRDAEIEVVPAAPEGGFPFLGAAAAEPVPTGLRRFRSDHQARDALTDMLSLDQVFPEDFDAALCIGSPGLGGMAASLLAAFLAAGRPVALMPSALGPAASGLFIADTPIDAAQALIGALPSSKGSTDV